MSQRILIIEDDEKTASFIAKGLMDEGFLVETVHDGRDGLFHATDSAFDAIVLDRMLPGMDGMALTRQIRQRFPAITVSMPIIALTANTNPVDRQRCLDAGMDDVLDKPMDLQALTRCVSHHVLKARG